MEEWRPIPSTNGWYSASSLGRIRSHSGAGPKLFGRILSPNIVGAGYERVHIARPGRRGRPVYVHRLVAEAFLGSCPVGLVVNHKNENKRDNRPANLEYVTPRQNLAWSRETINARRRRKVTGDAKLEIIRSRGRETQERIAARFGISQTRVSQIQRGK